MADRAAKSTGFLLVIFLLLLAVAVLAASSWQFYRKNIALQQQVTELQNSQVVLMVPDEQAAQIAQWMGQHPEQTTSLLDAITPVKDGVPATVPQELRQPQLPKAQETKVAGTVDSKVPDAETATVKGTSMQPNMPAIQQRADGVKVIQLPHGGIRVTTRDSDK